MNSKIIITIILIAAGLGLIFVVRRPATMSKQAVENQAKNSSVPATDSAVKLVSPQEFAALAMEANAFVVDVHTPEQTHIPATDAFIPYDQITANVGKLPTDKLTPILVYCRSGGMSAQAAKDIANLGYTTVYDLEGGTDAYKESNVSVSLTPDTRDLGTVVYGDVATTTFTITNYSPLPLKITRVSTSCGCTKATVEKEELEAYESTLINVTFDPAVHKDDTDLGELARTIFIETDNPNFPEFESKITATVVK